MSDELVLAMKAAVDDALYDDRHAGVDEQVYRAIHACAEVARARLEVAEGLIRKYATADDYRWDGTRYEPGFITNTESRLIDDLLSSLAEGTKP